MKHHIKQTSYPFLVLLLLVLGCSKEETPEIVSPETTNTTATVTPTVTPTTTATTPSSTQTVTAIPEEVGQLYIEKGNVTSNKVFLYLIGGPVSELFTDDFDDLKLSDYHEVYVHQAQTLSYTLISGLNKDLSFERATAENKVSVEILHRVVTHFQQQQKQVHLVGHSFGAFLLLSYMATYDTSQLPILCMAGRLEMPEEVWKGFRDRKAFSFENGITPVQEIFPSEISVEILHKLYAGMRLQAAVGQYRYTELIKGKDLAKLLFVYAEKDVAVGRLTAAETTFLEQHKASVYKIPNGEHGSMFENPHKEEILKLFFAME